MRLGTWDDEPADPLVDRYDQLDDVLGTTATAFLGITLRCARCHDHKFEPFSQVDYYRMLAVFEPLKRPQNDRDELDRPVGTEAELAAYRAAVGQGRRRLRTALGPDRGAAPAGDRPAACSAGKVEGRQAGKTADVAAAGGGRDAQARVWQANRRAIGSWCGLPRGRSWRRPASSLPTEVKAALKPLDERIAALEAARPKELPHAYIWDEDGPKAPITHVLKRGDPTRPGAVVEPGVPAVLAAGPLGAPRSTARSTGRRLWLARWLTGRENPLVARVIVNRIWQYHFGQGTRRILE